MIAFHFPPQSGSSGVQRTLRFVQHLPDFGWQPLVLTAQARAYERTSDDLLAEVPADTVVERAFALDAARHLSIAGRYLRATALPDRWNSWRFDAVKKGLRMIETYRPELIWSTYPIATAHTIGHELHRRTGLPWIADFRDPMVQPGYPPVAAIRRSYLQVESGLMQTADCCVFTTPGARQRYDERYPTSRAKRVVIENGYDESSFTGLQGHAPPPGPLVLLHSGIVYPQERDPEPLIKALRILKGGGLTPAQLKLRFRAAVHDDLLRNLAQAEGVTDFIELVPPIGYRAALQEMLNASALLVMQSAQCNDQIPGKLYEYFRAGRPVVGLTDAAGDTASTLRAAGVPYLADCTDSQAIATLLKQVVSDHTAGVCAVPSAESARTSSRVARSRELAALLNELANTRKAAASGA